MGKASCGMYACMYTCFEQRQRERERARDVRVFGAKANFVLLSCSAMTDDVLRRHLHLTSI